MLSLAVANRLRGGPDNIIHIGVCIYGMKKMLLIIVHAVLGAEEFYL